MSRPRLSERILAARIQRQMQGRSRATRAITRRDGVRCEVDGRWLTNFSGNDYLGLSQQFGVVDALQAAASRDGVGAGASHLVSGHYQIHEQLEREVAEWLGAPRALLFGSGYLANLGVMQALLGEDDVCVQDRLNHASLIDAARLSGCKLRRYPHNDAEGALRQLRTVPEGAAMLATDGVFSMDGDIAPLRELSLVEPLRTLRMLHYAAWLGRRWDDPAFPHNFPWFNTQAYWERHVLELREQFSLLSEPMWAADLLH